MSCGCKSSNKNNEKKDDIVEEIISYLEADESNKTINKEETKKEKTTWMTSLRRLVKQF
jgi:hypothetical protein